MTNIETSLGLRAQGTTSKPRCDDDVGSGDAGYCGICCDGAGGWVGYSRNNVWDIAAKYSPGCKPVSNPAASRSYCLIAIIFQSATQLPRLKICR